MTIVLWFLLAAVGLAQSVEWVAFPMVAPGSTTQRAYYAVSVPPSGSGLNITVERFFPSVDVQISRVDGVPIVGSAGLWCLGAAGARVAFLARVAPGQVIETLTGVPRWQSAGACGLAVPMPADTLAVHAVIVSGVSSPP